MKIRRWWKQLGTSSRARTKSLRMMMTLSSLLRYCRKLEKQGNQGVVSLYMKWQEPKYRAAIRMTRIGLGHKAFRVTGREWDSEL